MPTAQSKTTVPWRLSRLLWLVVAVAGAGCTAAEPYRSSQAPTGSDGGSTGSGGSGIIDGTGGSGGFDPEDAGNSDDVPPSGGTGGQIQPPIDAGSGGAGTGGAGTGGAGTGGAGT